MDDHQGRGTALPLVVHAAMWERLFEGDAPKKKRPARADPRGGAKTGGVPSGQPRLCPGLRSRAVTTDHVYMIVTPPARGGSFHRRCTVPGAGARAAREARIGRIAVVRIKVIIIMGMAELPERDRRALAWLRTRYLNPDPVPPRRR
jgi:hypothetical protein